MESRLVANCAGSIIELLESGEKHKDYGARFIVTFDKDTGDIIKITKKYSDKNKKDKVLYRDNGSHSKKLLRGNELDGRMIELAESHKKTSQAIYEKAVDAAKEAFKNALDKTDTTKDAT